jgi:putative transposase
VTWKQNGIKHDAKHTRVRLSKGWNLKDGRSDFLLAEYGTRPDVQVENIRQVRAVWNGDEWELHLVCNKEIPVADAPGDNTAGTDLGISTYLAIDYEGGPSELYPGNTLKEDRHYFTREEYQTEGETGPSKRALKARPKLSRRKDHVLHTLSKQIDERCVEDGVEKIAVGDLSDIREDENGDSRNWGSSGNKKLHGWEFVEDLNVSGMLQQRGNARNKQDASWRGFIEMLEYKGDLYGTHVVQVNPCGTTKECAECGVETDKPLWVREHSCPSCGFEADRDANASYNVLARGLQEIGLGQAESTAVETATAVETDGGSSSSVPASRVVETGSLGA